MNNKYPGIKHQNSVTEILHTRLYPADTKSKKRFFCDFVAMEICIAWENGLANEEWTLGFLKKHFSDHSHELLEKVTGEVTRSFEVKVVAAV